jgi:hypothetical protein
MNEFILFKKAIKLYIYRLKKMDKLIRYVGYASLLYLFIILPILFTIEFIEALTEGFTAVFIIKSILSFMIVYFIYYKLIKDYLNLHLKTNDKTVIPISLLPLTNNNFYTDRQYSIIDNHSKLNYLSNFYKLGNYDILEMIKYNNNFEFFLDKVIILCKYNSGKTTITIVNKDSYIDIKNDYDGSDLLNVISNES